MERFGLGRLFEDLLAPPSSPLYGVLGAVCLLVLSGSLYVLVLTEQRYPEQDPRRRFLRRYAGWLGTFSAVGAASVAFALLTTPFLSKRIWPALAAAGLVGTLAHLIVTLRRRSARPADDEGRAERARAQPARRKRRRGNRR